MPGQAWILGRGIAERLRPLSNIVDIFLVLALPVSRLEAKQWPGDSLRLASRRCGNIQAVSWQS